MSAQEIVAIAGGILIGWLGMLTRLRNRKTSWEDVIIGVVVTVVGGLVLWGAIAGLSSLFSGDKKLTETTAARFVPANGSLIGRGLDIEKLQRAQHCVRSYVDLNRSDAYRCWAGQTVADPCFYLPNRDFYACYRTPWSKTNYSVDTIEHAFYLDKPPAKFPASVREDWSIPWAIELESGDKCIRLESKNVEYPTGTTYFCEEGWLFGIPEFGSQPWRIEFQLPEERTFETVAIATVWI